LVSRLTAGATIFFVTMETNKNNASALTPLLGEKVYHLNEIESTLIDLLRERTHDVILEELEVIYQTASFTSEEDTDKFAKECLFDFYLILEILKGRTEKVRETFIPEAYKKDTSGPLSS
jgi:hypothetical protein